MAAYTTHAPILINGNSGFHGPNASTGISWGSGTASDPYIIDGWDISASTANGIEIDNVDAHFIIRNCYLHDGLGTFSGILLDNCTNGALTENTCSNNYDCIGIMNSHGIIVSNNSVNNSDISDLYGISLYNSNNNTVANNECLDNDVGIFLAHDMTPCENNTVIGNNCSSNTFSGIYLFLANNNLLNNNTCLNNFAYGIELEGSSYNNILSNNNCTSNDVFGIIFIGSNSNIVRDNTIDSNGYNGMKLVSTAHDNLIYNNTISNNTRYGITCEVATTNNRIWNNTFYHNNGTGDVYNPALIQAHDNGTSNYWNSTDGYGNLWSDWTTPDSFPPWGIVDNPYNVSGDALAKDFNPRTNAPVIPEFSDILIPITGLIMLALAIGRIRKSSPPLLRS